MSDKTRIAGYNKQINVGKPRKVAVGEKLKPCPFCGGEAKLWRGDWPSGDWGVSCTDSGCGVNISPYSLTDLEAVDGGKIAAIHLWNTRSSPALVLAQKALEKAYAHHKIWAACSDSRDARWPDYLPDYEEALAAIKQMEGV